ncbi:MAG: phosphoglycerate kinase [Nitrospiria bacterium]
MNTNKVTIEDVDIRGKQLFIRVDFNVPLDQDLNITDDTRIRSALPTINYAIDEGASIILASHLGRPKGVDPRYSLAPVAKRLQRLLGKDVLFASDCIGAQTEKMAKNLKRGEILLLENLRFHEGEQNNDEAFARALAKLRLDIYINDAFGTAHREHASTIHLAKLTKTRACGFLMKKEISYMVGAVSNPARPFVAILGGAKVSGKIGVIENLGQKVDKVIVGGGMAFTFLKASGIEVGNSLVEESMLDFAREIMQNAIARGVKFYLPVDCIVATSTDPSAEAKSVPVQEIPKGWMGLDIGRASVHLFTEALQDAKTILWNGPMGLFEVDAYSRGTSAIAHAVANAYAMTIAGGGETSLAVHKANESENISFISTGGGAALQLLEGKTLPGLSVLPDKELLI